MFGRSCHGDIVVVVSCLRKARQSRRGKGPRLERAKSTYDRERAMDLSYRCRKSVFRSFLLWKIFVSELFKDLC